MASGPAAKRRSNQSGRAAVTIVEREGEIEIPIEAFRRIRHEIPARILAPDMSHFTTNCNHRRRMKEDIQAFVRANETVVFIRSRAPSYLAELLRRAGYDVNCDRGPIPERFAVLKSVDVGAKLTPVEQELITLLRFGQFAVPSANAAVALAASIVMGFPSAPFVIPFASAERALRFRDSLQILVNEPIDYASGLTAVPESRITVCTYWAAKSLTLFECPGVIFAEWPGGMHEWMKSIATYPYRERMYLIRTETDRVCRADEEELIHFVGPMIIDCRDSVTRHELHCVRFGGPVSKQKSTVPSIKRQLYWTHHRRNVLVAALGREIARQYCSGESGDAPGSTITILVEVPEHARQLQALLPDWTVVTLDDPAVPLPCVSIITLSAADNHSEFRPDWVVFGMGGSPSPRFACWLDTWAKSGHSVHVVDLSDGFDPRAAELAEARAHDMKRHHADWRPLANKITKAALDRLRASCRTGRQPTTGRKEVRRRKAEFPEIQKKAN